MADWLDKVVLEDANDIAKDIIDQNNRNSLIPSLNACVDCDDLIPEKRKLLGGIEYCISCQNYHDTLNKRKQINLKC